jgi:hypothetical protein
MQRGLMYTYIYNMLRKAGQVAAAGVTAAAGGVAYIEHAYPRFRRAQAVDPSRQYKVGSVRHRFGRATVDTQIFYPCVGGAGAVPDGDSRYYMRDAAVDGFAAISKSVPSQLVQLMVSRKPHHCHVHATPVACQDQPRFPVVVFSHGLFGKYVQQAARRTQPSRPFQLTTSLPNSARRCTPHCAQTWRARASS